MSSSRPSTNSRPSASKWPTSPVAISPSMAVLVAAAGVALEQHLASRRRCGPLAPVASSPPSSSRILTTVPRGGRPAVPGAARRSTGRPPRWPRPPRSSRRGCRGRRRRRPSPGWPAGPGAPSRSPRSRAATTCLGAGDARGQLEHPLEHHRHDDEGVGAVLGDRAQRLQRVETAAGGRWSRRGRCPAACGRSPRRGRAAPRSRSSRGPAAGSAESSAAIGLERVGAGAVGALRRAGGARGEDDRAARPTAGGGGGVDARGDAGRASERVARIAGSASASRSQADEADGGAARLARRAPANSRSIDDRVGALALDDLGHLRAGEPGVEQDDVHAELGARATATSTKPRWLRHMIASAVGPRSARGRRGRGRARWCGARPRRR